MSDQPKGPEPAARVEDASLSEEDLGEDELLGTTLSNTYELVAVLGEGGTGRVYEAHHTRIPSKRFALKLLHPEYARNPEAVVRYAREAEATSRLGGKHAVAVIDVDQMPDGRPFLVSEYLDGIDLGELLEKKGALPVKLAAGIARQMCDALAEAHEQGVVHRDIKPGNVFLVGDLDRPTAKVLDFGLSKLEDAATLTRAGMIMGTPIYMSPEQALGLAADHRTDIYGVGVVLYHCLTGAVPFDRDDPAALMFAVMNEDPPRLRALVESIPEDLELVVQRAMAKAPDERFQSIEELDAALAPHAPPPQGEAEGGSSSQVMMVAGPTRQLANDIQHARLWLAVWLVLGVLWLVAASVAAITGAVGLLKGSAAGLTRTEHIVVMIGVSTTLLTPLLLVIRHVRGHTWSNTPKVLKLLDQVRAPLIAAFASYGAAALVVMFADLVLVGVVDWALVAARGTTHWPMWSLLFLAVSIVAACAAAIYRSLAWQPPEQRSRLARLGAGPLLTIVAVAASGALLWGGFHWRNTVVRAASAPAQLEAGALSASPASSLAEQAPSADASAVDIDTAKREGRAALEALASAHPDNPRVLRELALAQARTEAGQVAALGTLASLFELSPEQLRHADVRSVIVRAALGPDDVSAAAFDLMATGMGSHGPDILYDLMISNKQLRKRAKAALAEPAVRARSSASLHVAYDLRIAETCKAVRGVLDRAAKDGDGRAVTILSYHSDGTKSGCGWNKRQPCPAKCRSDRALIRKTTKQIQKRLEHR